MLMGEVKDNKVTLTITLDPLQEELVGTQFQINYDNTVLKFDNTEFKTKGNPINFNNNKGSSVVLGSLITDGSSLLDKTTEYKITFTLLSTLDSMLGLVSVSSTDAVNKNGKQLKVTLK
jgi:hypothetical protein